LGAPSSGKSARHYIEEGLKAFGILTEGRYRMHHFSGSDRHE
jgi:hypothetical protein